MSSTYPRLGQSTLARGGWLRGLLQFPAAQGSPAQAKLQWLVKLRWGALILAFFFAGPAYAIGFLPKESLPIFIGIVACTGLFNLLTQLLLPNKAGAISEGLLGLQMILDLFVMVALVRLMGGLSNPVAVLFYLHVVLGGLLLQRGRSWIFLLSLHGALLWLQAANLSFPITEQNAVYVLLPHAMVLLFWHCTHFLGQHLDHQHRRLLRATVAAEKQDRLRALGALAAGFSHEFASPLQTIRLKLDRLAKGAGSAEDIGVARQAVDDCARVLHAMNESQFDVRSSQPTPVELPRLLSEIVSRWERENGRSVSLKAGESLATSLTLLSFAQTVINLLDNAHEASREGAIDLELKVIQEQINLSVRDHGPGFDPKLLQRLGEPFNTSKPEGTGLGLYVAEIFVQNLGGRLEAGNHPDGGALVSLSWPRGKTG